MPALAIFRFLTLTLLLTVVCVTPGACFQEIALENSQAKACSKYYLFEFGGYHYYSTVICSQNLPCSETSSEVMNIHSAKLKAVGCLPNNASCGCQALEPEGQVELVRGKVEPAPGDSVLDWNPVDEDGRARNPQDGKWVAIARHSLPKYAVTTADFEGIPRGTYYYLVEFKPMVWDFDPETGIQLGTEKEISGLICLAIRLSSEPPRDSKIYSAEPVEQQGALRLRVAQHSTLFSATR